MGACKSSGCCFVVGACLVTFAPGCGDDGSAGSASASASGTDTTAGSATMSTSTTTTTADTSASTVGSETLDGSGSSDTASTTDMSTTGSTSADTTGGSTSAGTAGSTGGTTGGSTGTDTGMQDCDCAENTDLTYVLSDDAELWSYDPMNDQFALISSFNCAGMTDTFSMGVSRSGIAWVMFQNADIYNIDVNNPNMCTDPGYTPGQQGFDLFGMAFVSESLFDNCDQLYGNTYSGVGGFSEGPNAGRLGVVDPDNVTLTEIGFTDYDGAELTGTGDGRLFLFAGVNPAKLIELDKDDASVLDILPLGNLDLTNAFAFAFFAGDFYFFTESSLNPSISQVVHLDYDDDDMTGMQELTVVNQNAPIRVVGAGVSTCAPVEPS